MHGGSPGGLDSGPADAQPAGRALLAGPLSALAWGSAYYLGGLVGLHTTLPDLPLVLVAPSSGVLVVWFSFVTRRAVGWHLAVLAGGSFLLSSQLGLPLGVAAVGPLISMAQAAVFVGLMRWSTTDLAPFGGRRPDWELPDLGAFLCAALGAALVSAVLTTVTQGAAGLATGDVATFLVRWGRSSSANVVLGTVGLLAAPVVRRMWAQRRRGVAGRPQLPSADHRTLERLTLLAATLGAGLACFFWLDHLPLTFLLFVLTGWVGLRFSPLTAALQGLLVGGLTVGATLSGHGIFSAAVAQPAQRAAIAQLFVLVVSASGVALAVTRRQLTVAERLAEARARMLDQVLGAVSDGILVIAEDGSIPMMNRASQRLVGADRPATQALPADRLPLFDSSGQRVTDDRAPHRRALAGETVSGEDYELRLEDPARARYLRVSAERLPRDPGEPLRALVSVHDITSDRLHVDALATFAANVAHDLRGPLSVVEAWNEVLSDAFETGDDVPASYGAPMTAKIAAASARMRDFIQALLDYTLARDRAMVLGEVDLVAVARDVADLRCQTGHAEPPVIRVAGSGRALADPVLIRIVVDNLVANACKYVAPGVRPHILVTVDDLGAGTVQLCVVDNGIGIPADQRDQVFRSFHRVELDGTIEGSGLGLGICHRIVERHGGSIRVDDVTDGTSLRVTLPSARPGRASSRPGSTATPLGESAFGR